MSLIGFLDLSAVGGPGVFGDDGTCLAPSSGPRRSGLWHHPTRALHPRPLPEPAARAPHPGILRPGVTVSCPSFRRTRRSGRTRADLVLSAASTGADPACRGVVVHVDMAIDASRFRPDTEDTQPWPKMQTALPESWRSLKPSACRPSTAKAEPAARPRLPSWPRPRPREARAPRLHRVFP